MALSRRSILTGAAMLPLTAQAFRFEAAAQTTTGTPAGSDIPPILFVHGNGDHAALWMTQIWRMESNGVPGNRLMALNFTDPLARSDDAVPQQNRSSTEDQRRELGEAIAQLKARTGAPKVALVANSRGGYAVRSYIKNGGGDVSHAVLCGTPNHGVFDWADSPGSEFNGRGPFLRGLNSSDGSEVTEGTAFLTLRSDSIDKYAQPDGRFAGKPGVATGITFDGPALRGATNLALGAIDHRETGFHPRAFREIYKFIAGREPSRIDIAPEAEVKLSGIVTGTPGGVPTNRPVPDANVEVFRVAAETGERIGGPLYAARTKADGRWGPVQVDATWPLEIVLTAGGGPITHSYRSPFPRSSDVVHLRAGRPLTAADANAGAVVSMARVRGYFGLPRDIVLLDGKEPADVKPGVPTDPLSTVRLSATEIARPVVAIFNQERIAARAWPVAENRVVVAEFTD